MFQKQKNIILVFLLLCFHSSFSQVIVPKKDSLEVYKDIQIYSKKNKFTKFMHKLLFRPIYTRKRKAKKIVAINYSKLEGKIIRNINIVTLDPFGYSEIDTTQKPRNWAEKNGNFIHNKTKNFAIRNSLLITENKPFNSLLVKESIRLLRAQNYINRVAIETKLIARNADSVDVFIRVLDSWSMIPKVSLSNSQTNLNLIERNFFGTGHTFNSKYKQRFSDGKKGYDLEYIVPNIKNTFVQTKLNYFNDIDDNQGKSINIERPFYSYFAKWAGGINLDHQFKIDSLSDANLVYAKQSFKYTSQDLWGGRAFTIFKGNSGNDRITNLIVTGRYLHVKYLDSPIIDYDPIDFYSSEQFVLTGIGISMRKFVEDRYIFRNGATEDVPIGKIVGITSGYQYKNDVGKFYLGGRVSFGDYYSWGFLSTNFELGTFFNQSKTTQTAFSFQANYFSKLIDLGDWKLRQFVKPQLLIGINRQNSIGDQLSINERYGIQGFKSAVYGTQKMVLTFQTQAYSTWNLFGFRLNPYFNYTIAMLGDESRGLMKSKAYSKIGIGFIIANDYLVFRSFQISLSFYPSIPGNGNNIFKTNSFNTSDFGFQEFGLDKPRTVIYK
ncbi:BamA/TamA family outer membrane protein [Flavobacterium cellulosilyticum]|uniref:Outer membrane protein assembly factor n=1 Tax=Flavobacterium cellulosilyticum TaxID=2541731 RepID=A0A4R5CGT7_9FLAO|nr:hypothetical protein [Flavobacterium cellulosilyticum]TDD97493.1 hypothetical protein E0F76_09315 [Flavobacterium cellulosilyticum]